MKTTRCAVALAVVLGITILVPASRADEPKPAAPPAEAKKPEPIPEPKSFVSKHRLQSGSTDIAYTATAEEIDIRDGEGKQTARFFTISYVKDGVTRPEDRPVTFVFNGGPGSASVWLHFGLVGPKIVDIPSDATDPGGPPYKLRDNPATILRATDLVFVDPVGTGFSRALGEKKDEDFWGYDEDADSVAEFIRTFITMKNRWNSPKYILGESYGGIRSSMLVPRLQQRLSIGLNGVILISPAINMGMLPYDIAGNDLPYVTMLPAYAAAAYYHGKLPDKWASRAELLAEVEKFASTEYAAALFKGDLIDAKEKQRIAEMLHRYTGLPTDYIVRSDLRIYTGRFLKELLRDQGKAIGRLDSRYAQDELDKVGEAVDSDPFDAKTGSAYLATFQSYLRNDLKVDFTKPYVAGNGKAGQNWKRPAPKNNAFAGYIDVTASLAQGTKDNEAMRVFAAGGYNDLATSYFATQYMLHHSGIDPKRLTIKVYDGGHMMYLHQPSLEALSSDIVAFMGGK